MPKNKRPYPRFAQDFGGESLTQQNFVESSDVNNIVKHFVATGHDPRAELASTQKFGFASSQTFSEALRATAEIQSAFEDLPSATRREFANDSGAWLDSLAFPPPLPEEIVAPEPSEALPPEKIEAKTAESAEIDST